MTCNCFMGEETKEPWLHNKTCPASGPAPERYGKIRSVEDRVREARRRECDRYGIPYSWEGVE